MHCDTAQFVTVTFRSHPAARAAAEHVLPLVNWPYRPMIVADARPRDAVLKSTIGGLSPARGLTNAVSQIADSRTRSQRQVHVAAVGTGLGGFRQCFRRHRSCRRSAASRRTFGPVGTCCRRPTTDR